MLDFFFQEERILILASTSSTGNKGVGVPLRTRTRTRTVLFSARRISSGGFDRTPDRIA